MISVGLSDYKPSDKDSDGVSSIVTRLFAKAALPFVLVWARKHERAILREGVPLSVERIAEARRIGVDHPERVRVLVVKSIPPRLPGPLRRVAGRYGISPAQTAGMALGYGIFLRVDHQHEPALLRHELVHTAQYERLGFSAFLAQYLHECFSAGYPFGPLEEEARQVAREIG